MTLTGTLSREFFGGEVWVLRTDDGGQYQLAGSVPAKFEGKRVKVDATPSNNNFGISMVGQVLDLQSIKSA